MLCYLKTRLNLTSALYLTPILSDWSRSPNTVKLEAINTIRVIYQQNGFKSTINVTLMAITIRSHYLNIDKPPKEQRRVVVSLKMWCECSEFEYSRRSSLKFFSMWRSHKWIFRITHYFKKGFNAAWLEPKTSPVRLRNDWWLDYI